MVPVEEPIVDAEFDLVRSRGSGVHVVPTPAGWFSWKEIHPIEKHTLASFFNGKSESRTPEIYMEVRNSIMRKFHADPHTQLEVKDMEEISIGDSEMKQEVMEFLDHWGLINFHPFPPENQDTGNSDAGDENMTSLIEKLYQFETVQSCSRFVPKKVEASTPAITPRFFPESSITDELVGPAGPSVEYHCNSCSADCSRKRYHCQKQADFDLCSECYNNEKFGSDMSPSDFILMEPAEVPGVSGGSWTDQETLLLLEALELFGENWNEIAEHVATKTKTQCILHFLQMPIEDPFLEGSEDADENTQEQVDSGSANGENDASAVHETKEVESKDQPVSSPTDISKDKNDSEFEVSCENGVNIAIDALKAAFQAIGYMPEQEGLPSFAEAGNPVMALAAFLTKLVEPTAASTSFRSSLKAMSEDSPGLQLAARHCFLLEDPPSDMKESPALESAATGTSNGDTAKEENQAKITDENDESRDGMDKDEGNATPVKNEQCLSRENKNSSIENEKMVMEIDKNSSAMETDNSSPKENEKTDLENDKSPLVENQKMSVKSDKNQFMENGSNLSPENTKNPSVENGKPATTENENTSVSLQCLDKPSAAKGYNVSILPSDGATNGTKDLPEASANSTEDLGNQTLVLPSNPKDLGNPVLPGEQIGPDSTMDGSSSASPMVLSSTNLKDSGESSLQGQAVSTAANEGKESKLTSGNKADSVKDSDNLASVNGLEQMPNASMTADKKPPSEDKEYKQNPSTNLTVESKEASDVDDRKVSSSENMKSNNSSGANDDKNNYSIIKLKRAAVTVLSAASVKAKLLANHEEDQIRQLVSLIIEKQLHKLEVKLAMFADIESVIMRMREQTERARHRLMHERAQIIAARLGLAAPGRGNPGSLPTNKLAMGYGATGPNPNPGAISSQKAPPMRRP
ncbi:uncharacterized protein A4U43_C08F8370 [Asparagus officinalis]|uniref:SWI/SNF complex subunit SWI3D-like n=2 Tax=Asparagus officinalis TaxID=4686 RepID=UPI00098E6C8A|nr:SWI/SNF complex subunit SWI3D-like [Asparagus officinalis]ONK59623.1 uncharacterized protein A4U43_C08F8370 [Asparagus officinalis]